ncbi:DUF3564 family protein [Caballeronia sp. RCC_10]|uniref:DUF3564 family protein n=1 Tax=Caballeronia sp. RCC_10 TaxID=3239227 RepID=UPI003523898D
MRITIKLDAFERAATAYAVLWLDVDSGRWSRESHDRIEIPSWGTWQTAVNGTLLTDRDTHAPLLLLCGLELNASAASRLSLPLQETHGGRADRLIVDENAATRPCDSGHWHIQCVDCEVIVAEHEIFSDEPDAPPEPASHPRNSGPLLT